MAIEAFRLVINGNILYSVIYRHGGDGLDIVVDVKFCPLNWIPV